LNHIQSEGRRRVEEQLIVRRQDKEQIAITVGWDWDCRVHKDL